MHQHYMYSQSYTQIARQSTMKHGRDNGSATSQQARHLPVEQTLSPQRSGSTHSSRLVLVRSVRLTKVVRAQWTALLAALLHVFR